MDDVSRTLRISAAGMKSQGTRLRIVAENIANADSKPAAAGDLPYRRRVVTFQNALDRATGTELVRVRDVGEDDAPFPRSWEPGHPAADSQGYVLSSNVNTLLEMTDLREAQRTYEANLDVIKSTKSMLQETIDVLR